ncbi:MAG TPA: lipid A biosynthesis acyltransferase [Sedimenticola sp.]|nr:lipid A biosynthesis acyltransferase [Sedimenticola sp.]
MEERGILWGMRFLLGVYLLLGRPAFRLFLYPVVGYYFVVNRQARAASREYLRQLHRFAPELGLDDTLWHSYRHFLSFAECLLDKIVVWLGRFETETVTFHHRNLFLELLDRGEGGLIVTAHLGNLEICRALADFRKRLRLNILVHTKHAQKFNRLLGSVDKARNMTLIQVTEIDPATAILLQDKVRQGEFVVLVGDRIPVGSPERVVELPFLGRPAPFPQGPWLLAHLLQCPVFTLFCYRRGGGYHIHFDPLHDRVRLPRGRSERLAAIRQQARPFVDRLQRHCLRAPLQWFNFYPFWSAP